MAVIDMLVAEWLKFDRVRAPGYRRYPARIDFVCYLGPNDESRNTGSC